jgi:hypothetical protein
MAMKFVLTTLIVLLPFFPGTDDRKIEVIDVEKWQ